MAPIFGWWTFKHPNSRWAAGVGDPSAKNESKVKRPVLIGKSKWNGAKESAKCVTHEFNESHAGIV